LERKKEEKKKWERNEGGRKANIGPKIARSFSGNRKERKERKG
jgi:hypothetical protein